jgi:hypothetical protein
MASAANDARVDQLFDTHSSMASARSSAAVVGSRSSSSMKRQFCRGNNVGEPGKDKALETVGVPKCKWTQVRERFMRVLLDGHDAILRSYRAQKYGDGDGIEAKPGQRVEFG